MVRPGFDLGVEHEVPPKPESLLTCFFHCGHNSQLLLSFLAFIFIVLSKMNFSLSLSFLKIIFWFLLIVAVFSLSLALVLLACLPLLNLFLWRFYWCTYLLLSPFSSSYYSLTIYDWSIVKEDPLSFYTLQKEFSKESYFQCPHLDNLLKIWYSSRVMILPFLIKSFQAFQTSCVLPG